MSESTEKARQKMDDFIKKVKNNESIRISLSYLEARKIMWWWIYTDEFGEPNEENEVSDNIIIEFNYCFNNEKEDFKLIQYRMYSKEYPPKENEGWLVIPLEDLMQQ